jgi:hypothetical protein
MTGCLELCRMNPDARRPPKSGIRPLASATAVNNGDTIAGI